MNSPHPIQERPDLPLDRRVQLLEQQLAQLWDQVWWVTLPVDQRRAYEADGFRQPIERFYHE